MKKIIITTLIAISFSVNAQINTRTGGSINVLPNSPTTNTNVGIGTNKPSEKLEVVGNIKAKRTILRYSPTNGTNYLTFPAKIEDCLVLSAGTELNDGGANTGTFNFMDFPSNSTDTPNARIWFEMMDRGATTRFRFNAAQNSNTEFILFDKLQNDFFKLSDDNFGASILSMKNPNSFIGIGTENFNDGNDIYKLSVNGAIRAHRVKVYTTWADFVFEKDYKLPTLEEVEKHIQEKGHLIDIPSAKEVEEKGIELGEMNKKLLQKVEELTLYIIEMNKELQDVKKQLKDK